VVGQPVGSFLQLAVAEPPVADHHRLSVGHGVGHDLEQVGEVEAGRGGLLSLTFLVPRGRAVA
jgi:hypothetical protein